MNKSDFDDEFERLFDEAAGESSHFPAASIPDPAASWASLQIKLQKERRKAVRIRRIKWVSCCAASLTAGALLFSTLHKTEAFRPMFEMVYKVKENSITIRSTESQSTAGAKTPPPPPDDMLPPQKLPDNRDLPEGGSFRRVKVTLEEAVTGTQFAMQKPGYIPDDYAFLEATVHLSLGDSKASAVKLVYQSSDNNQRKLQILIRKRILSANEDRPDSQRTVTARPDSLTELEWNNLDTNIIVQGAVSEQELNRIADGLTAKQ